MGCCGPPTVNVGTIAGGVQPNMVPARCAITVDRRTVPGERDAAVCREIVARLRAKGLSVTLSNIRPVPCVPLETDPSLPLVRRLMELAGQEGPLGVDYFCDAAVLASGGIPSVVFGPGEIAQAHTADEWMAVKSLARGTAILREYLRCLP